MAAFPLPDLGIVASPAHSADAHASSHNCASTPGGQESPLAGVGYDPGYAHAWDTNTTDTALGDRLVAALLVDRRTRYCIWRNVLYLPVHRGGGASPRPGHPTFHWSAMPGTTFDTRPFDLTRGDPAMSQLTREEAARWEHDTRRLVIESMARLLREQDGRLVAVLALVEHHVLAAIDGIGGAGAGVREAELHQAVAGKESPAELADRLVVEIGTRLSDEHEASAPAGDVRRPEG